MSKIFVFGSNREGRHGKGAALAARKNHGAVYGQALGRQGNAYAIITKELRPHHPSVSIGEIKCHVDDFLEYAKANPKLQFLVSPIGCGLAGFLPSQIAPMFKNRTENVQLPVEFEDVLFEEKDQEQHEEEI